LDVCESRIATVPATLDGLTVGLFSNAYHPLISGVVNSVELIQQQLIKQGHHPHLFVPNAQPVSAGAAFLNCFQATFQGSDEDAKELEQQQLENWEPDLHPFPSFNVLRDVTFPVTIPYSREAFTTLATQGFQIFHTHHPVWLGDVAWFWARRLGIPLLFTFHTQYDQYLHYVPLPSAFLKKAVRMAVLSFTRRCQLIIAPSDMIADYLNEIGVDSRVITLRNAIDLSRFARANVALEHIEAKKAELGILPEHRVALYAGRLGQEKNLEFLLNSFAQAVQQSKELGKLQRLLIAGSGPDLEALKQLAYSLAIDSQVHFLGRVDYAEMPTIYACADYFAMSSVTEVKPLVVLEALAAGLPVLAVAACGTADTIKDDRDGWLCSHNQEEHAEKFKQVFTSSRSQLDRMSGAAQETSCQYSIVRYVERLTDIYRDEISRYQLKPRRKFRWIPDSPAAIAEKSELSG
jgi:1,2-diacylglycerol 3-alpha-glucosyltransferase